MTNGLTGFATLMIKYESSLFIRSLPKSPLYKRHHASDRFPLDYFLLYQAPCVCRVDSL